jgi:erythromycin esterase
MRGFGALVPRWTYQLNLSPTALAKEYDGLVYVAVSTCSRPLSVAYRWRSRHKHTGTPGQQ